MIELNKNNEERRAPLNIGGGVGGGCAPPMIELNNSAKHSGGVGRGAASPVIELNKNDEERRAPPNRGGGVGGGGAQLRQTGAGGLGGTQPANWLSESRGLGMGIRGSGFGIRDSALGARVRNWDSGFGNSGFGIRDSGFGIGCLVLNGPEY